MLKHLEGVNITERGSDAVKETFTQRDTDGVRHTEDGRGQTKS